MTADDVTRELLLLPRNTPQAAADLYRRASAYGVAYAGLATTLLRLQDNWAELWPQLAAIDAEFKTEPQ